MKTLLTLATIFTSTFFTPSFFQDIYLIRPKPAKKAKILSFVDNHQVFKTGETSEFKGKIIGDADQVKVKIDNYLIGTSRLNSGVYQVNYKIWTSKLNRVLTIEAYSQGEIVQKNNITIHVLSENTPFALMDLKSLQKVMVGNTHRFRGTQSKDIYRLVFKVDDWPIKELNNREGKSEFNFDYRVNHFEKERKLTVEAETSNGQKFNIEYQMTMIRPLTIALNDYVNEELIPIDTPMTFSGSVSNEVQTIQVFQDEKLIGESNTANESFEFKHTFQSNTDRKRTLIRFRGVDEYGGSVETSRNFYLVPKEQANKLFNNSILRGLDKLYKKNGLQGYFIKAVLTENYQYPDEGLIKRTYGKLSMCVSTVMESILLAFEEYQKFSNSIGHYKFLNIDHFKRLSPLDLKSFIWVVHDYWGAGQGIESLGLGKMVPFKDLLPGSFVQFWRYTSSSTPSGHSVIFLGFIDKTGKILDRYSEKVAGFKYISSQGKREVGRGGVGFRYAFFRGSGCPQIEQKRDCWLKFSTSQKVLNTAMMFKPNFWDKEKYQDFRIKNQRRYRRNRNYENIPTPDFFDGTTIDD